MANIDIDIDSIISTLDPILKFIENDDVCSEDSLKKIRTMCSDRIDKLLSLLTNQHPSNQSYPDQSIYKINIFNNKVSHELNLQNSKDTYTHPRIYYDEYNIFMLTFSHEEFICHTSQTKSRYVFHPLAFTSETIKNGHQTCIIVDTQQNEILLFDPNGRHSYFNQVFKETNGEFKDYDVMEESSLNGEELVDGLMKKYVEDINDKFDTKYKYVSSKQWNLTGKTMNGDYKSLISNGHCVVLTLMFIHYIHLTQNDVNSSYKNFSNLSDSEMLEIINGYSLFISNLIN